MGDEADADWEVGLIEWGADVATMRRGEMAKKAGKRVKVLGAGGRVEPGGLDLGPAPAFVGTVPGRAGALTLQNLTDKPATIEAASGSFQLGPRRKVHVVKSWPEFFNAIASGHKRAELRRDDRPDGSYQVGDHVIHQEYDPGGRGYTGREVRTEITNVMRRAVVASDRMAGNDVPDPLCHVPEGWCILSIELAGAPSVLVRALDGLCAVGEKVMEESCDAISASADLAAAIRAGRDALGVVTRT